MFMKTEKEENRVNRVLLIVTSDPENHTARYTVEEQVTFTTVAATTNTTSY